MNISALPELLLTWIKTQGAALLQPGQASPFQPGQDYQGTVLDQLPSGRFLVQVAEQQMDMNLPAGTRPGESLRLTFLNAGSRPTFLLNASPVAPVPEVQLSGTAQQVGALLRLNAVTATAQTAAATTATAQPLAAQAGVVALRNIAPPSQVAGTAPATPESAQVINPNGGFSTPVQPAILATTISKPAGMPAPAESTGMVSARPIVASVAMLQSPVNAVAGVAAAVTNAPAVIVGVAVDGLQAAQQSGTAVSAGTVAQLPEASREMLPARLAQTVSESGLFYESHLAKWVNGEMPRENLMREPQAAFNRPGLPGAGLPELAGMSGDAARMASQQLQLLEGGPFVWQGQAWPGQWMQWQVEEWKGGNRDAESEAANTWVSEIRVTLPSLGGVDARLALSGQRFSLKLASSEGPALERLRAALPELVQALKDAGLEPGRMTVEPVHG